MSILPHKTIAYRHMPPSLPPSLLHLQVRAMPTP